MSLNDALDLTVYWSKNPPTHIAVAAVLRSFGGNGKASDSPRIPTKEELKGGL